MADSVFYELADTPEEAANLTRTRPAHDRNRAAHQGRRLDADRSCSTASSHPATSFRPYERKDQQVQPSMRWSTC